MSRQYWRVSGYESAGEYVIEAERYATEHEQVVRRGCVHRVELGRMPVADRDPDHRYASVHAAVWAGVVRALDSVAGTASDVAEHELSVERFVRLLADVADLIQGGPFPANPGGPGDQAAPLRLESDSQGS